MSKLIVLSIVIMTFAIPMTAARSANPVQGLRRAVLGMASWIAIYVALLTLINR